jgi:hypothetical protein
MVQRRRPPVPSEDRSEELANVLRGLIPEVHQFALDWTARKRLGPDDADTVVSDVLDQLIRMIDQKQAAPANVAGWSRVTARCKWRAGCHLVDDVAEDAGRRADLDRQLCTIANELYRLWYWHIMQKPSQAPDAANYLAATHLVDRRSIELLEMIVRGTPDGEQAVADELARLAFPLSPCRTQAVGRLVREILRLRLHDQS